MKLEDQRTYDLSSSESQEGSY